MHYKYFVGHKPPDFPIWSGVKYYDHTNSTLEGGAQLIEDSNVLGEYLSLFKLKLTLRELGAGADDLITICQHRRFVLNTVKGLPANNSPARVIHPEDMLGINFSPELLPREGQRCLIGTPMVLKSAVMNQYAGAHYIRDVLRFASDMIDAALLTNKEAEDVLSQKILIPAPSTGTFEINFFLETMDYLEAAVAKFIQRGYIEYDDNYQSRVLAFLLERLNSWVLLRYVGKASFDLKKIIGFTTIVSRDLTIKPWTSQDLLDTK